MVLQGPRSKFLSGGGGGGLNWTNFVLGGGWRNAWEFLFNFFSDGKCFYNDKTINIFPHLQ